MADKNLHGLKEKMEELGSALLYNFSSAVWKFPSCVIQMQKLDDVGNLWFVVKKPAQCLDTFEKDFPAMLHFYKKGKPFHMKVHGKAVIIDDPELLVAIEEDLQHQLTEDMLLMKVKIQKVEHFEELPKDNFFASLKNMISKWILREEPGYHPYWIGSSDTATSF